MPTALDALDLESATRPAELGDLLKPLPAPRGSRLVAVAFCLLVIAHLVPLWGAKYFPSQDGPAHLENAQLLLKWMGGSDGLFRQYYFVNPKPIPNWLGHLALAALMTVVPPLVAEKILLSAYVIVLALAARYAVRSANRNADALCLVVFPLTYHALLHMGFYNFSFGVAMYLLCIGYWIRHRENLCGRTVTLGALVLLTYFTHAFALLAVWLTMAALAFALTISDVAQMKRGRLPRVVVREGFRSRALRAAVACMPALMLLCATAVWEVQQPTPLPELTPIKLPAGTRPIPPISTRPLDVLGEVPNVLVSFGEIERWPARTFFAALALAGACVLLAKARRGDWNGFDALLLLAMFFLAQAITATSIGARELFVRPRAEIFAAVAFIVWLATQERSRAVGPALASVAFVVAVAIVGIQFSQFRQLSADIDDYASAAKVIGKDSTVLPVFMPGAWRASARGTVAIQPGLFAHASGYVAVESGAVDLQNYEANTNHFPVLFRPEMNPYGHLGRGIELQPPVVTLADMRKTSAGDVDFVMVWGDLDRAAKQSESAADLKGQLASWKLIFTTPSGFGHVWKRS